MNLHNMIFECFLQIHSEGAVARDARLKVGQRILEVCQLLSSYMY